MTRDFQVVVVGGGPAGAVAALVLARLGQRVLLVDRGSQGRFQVGESLPAAAQPILRDLGVLDSFLRDGHLPCYGNVSLWGSNEPTTHDFIFDPHGHGWHLDRARFDAMLRIAAAKAGAEVLQEKRVVEVVRVEERWQLTIADGTVSREEIACDWVLDATGRRAVIARRLGIVRLRDDALVAFFARFRPTAGNTADYDGRTVVEAAPDGWWYSALVPSGERVVAFLGDGDLVDRTVILSPDGFVSHLDESLYLRHLLVTNRYTITGVPRSADAGSSRLSSVVGPGWIAVGDAAVAFDPLSSQGTLTALYTGMRAGEAVAVAVVGDGTLIDTYEDRVLSIDAAYRRNRSVYYGVEQRWPTRPFWQRRQQVGDVAAMARA